MMQVGIRIPCYRRWCDRDAVRAIATTVEASGFDSLWVQDHLVAPVGSDEETAVLGLDDWMSRPDRQGANRQRATVESYYAGDDWWLDPYATWGFLAGITEHVRLASDIVVVPYRNPIVQAKMLGTLDVLSGGRMIIGTGSGHVRSEAEALGTDFDARGRAHDEHLRVIKALLSQPEASFDGEFTRFGTVRSLVRPVQSPHPPIWVGGHGPRSIRRAVELGDGWLPSVAEPEALRQGIALLHETCERAGRSEPPTIALSLPSAFRFTSSQRPSSSASTSPDQVTDTLLRHAELGVEHVSLGFPMPNLDVYLDQIQTFTESVLPSIRRHANSNRSHP